MSEAEWEYCCRAGITTAYSTGDAIAPEQANFGGLHNGTTSVARFPPNPWGLGDMHGNVWEWCEDTWHPDYSGNPPSDGSAWPGGDDSLRVLRGGSWNNNPQNTPLGQPQQEPTRQPQQQYRLPGCQHAFGRSRPDHDPAGCARQAFRAAHDEHARGPRRDGRPRPQPRLSWETHGLRQAPLCFAEGYLRDEAGKLYAHATTTCMIFPAK